MIAVSLFLSLSLSLYIYIYINQSRVQVSPRKFLLSYSTADHGVSVEVGDEVEVLDEEEMPSVLMVDTACT
jgi:hypothetical protein